MGNGASGYDTFCESATDSFVESVMGSRGCEICTTFEQVGTCCSTPEDRFGFLCFDDMTISACTDIGGQFNSGECDNWTCEPPLSDVDSIACCACVYDPAIADWICAGSRVASATCKFANDNPDPFGRTRVTWSIGECASERNCGDHSDWGACCGQFADGTPFCSVNRAGTCSAATVFFIQGLGHLPFGACTSVCSKIPGDDGACYIQGSTACAQRSRRECRVQWSQSGGAPPDGGILTRRVFDDEGQPCSTTIYPGACCIGCGLCVEDMPEYLCNLIQGSLWKGVSTLCSGEDCSGV